MKNILIIFVTLLIACITNAQPNQALTEKVKKAFSECHKSTGAKVVDFSKGEKPSAEDQAKMKKCLESKNVLPKKVK